MFGKLVESLLERAQRPDPVYGAAAVLFCAGILQYSLWARRRDAGPKTVLVTGCANGLGRATVEWLISKGDFVIGTDVDANGLASLIKTYPGQFKGVMMNVADAGSVSQAYAEIARYASDKPCLDAIVNNAGIIRGGSLVELSDDQLAAVMSVNTLGTALVTKHFFPLLKRSCKSSFKPRVINFGSEVSYAWISAAFNGPYAMSKFAVEAYSASLRQEFMLLKDPVHVIILNPGAHSTAMTQNRGKVFGDEAIKQKSIYKHVLSRGEKIAQGYMDRHAKPAENIAKRIYELVHMVNPPRRVKINVSIEMEFARLTPQSVLDNAAYLGFQYFIS